MVQFLGVALESSRSPISLCLMKSHQNLLDSELNGPMRIELCINFTMLTADMNQWEFVSSCSLLMTSSDMIWIEKEWNGLKQIDTDLNGIKGSVDVN